MGYVINCNQMSTVCSVSSILRCLFIRWPILHKDPGSIAICVRAVDGVDSGIEHVTGPGYNIDKSHTRPSVHHRSHETVQCGGVTRDTDPRDT